MFNSYWALLTLALRRYANASAIASICRTSFSLFSGPASSLILPIHNHPHSVGSYSFWSAINPLPDPSARVLLASSFGMPSLSRSRFPEYFTPQASLFSTSLALSMTVVIYMSIGQTQKVFSRLPGLNLSSLWGHWHTGGIRGAGTSYKAEALLLSYLSFTEFIMFHYWLNIVWLLKSLLEGHMQCLLDYLGVVGICSHYTTTLHYYC